MVAIIDSGTDPGHPLFAHHLLPGHDFVRGVAGEASEWHGLDQQTMAILGGSDALPVNPSTAAILSDAGSFDPAGLPPAFGHGTMVAGLVHLTAPAASILPLRAFDGWGRGHLFDVVRAIYHAVDAGADVINMSFSLETYSPELMRAVNYAARRGVTCVAAAGNQGGEVIVYPAAFGNALGGAATDDAGALAAFSNHGSDLVSIAAPATPTSTSPPRPCPTPSRWRAGATAARATAGPTSSERWMSCAADRGSRPRHRASTRSSSSSPRVALWHIHRRAPVTAAMPCRRASWPSATNGSSGRSPTPAARPSLSRACPSTGRPRTARSSGSSSAARTSTGASTRRRRSPSTRAGTNTPSAGRSSPGIEPRQALVGAQPEPAEAVREDAVDDVVGQPVALVEAPEGARGALARPAPARCRYPWLRRRAARTAHGSKLLPPTSRLDRPVRRRGVGRYTARMPEQSGRRDDETGHEKKLDSSPGWFAGALPPPGLRATRSTRGAIGFHGSGDPAHSVFIRRFDDDGQIRLDKEISP